MADSSDPLPNLPLCAANHAYRITSELARSGTGAVYAARDSVIGREVAIKVLREPFCSDSPSADQFIAAGRLVGHLQHPHIVPVFDLGTLSDGRPYLVMKLVKGRTLDDLLKDTPDPSVDRARFLVVFVQVCQAVAYAHARRVVHRDLKPAHVMIGAFGEVQVIGWGTATLLGDTDETIPGVRSGTIVGTPTYMPPEQARGEGVGPPADVFGLGGILCHILTGAPPFTGETVGEVLRKAATGDVGDARARLNACGADAELVALANQCLSPRAADRPPEAGMLTGRVTACRVRLEAELARTELDRIQAEEQRARAEVETWRRRARRGSQLLFILGIAICLFFAGLVLVAR